MQKKNKIASILLWAIFISMILSLFFLSISTKITKNLKNNSNLIEENKINYLIKNQIKNYNFQTKKLFGNEYLVFENIEPLIRTLKKNETKEFLFNSGSQINLKINKKYGGDLYYKLFKGNSQNNINSLIGTGIISNKIETTLLDNSNHWGKIILTNLGGESKIKIYSQKSIIPNYINYKIVKIVGNNQIIKYKNKEKVF